MPFNKLNHSHLGEIRPRFHLRTSLSPEEALSVIGTSLREDQTVSGRVSKTHAFLRIPDQVAHYWSPELQARIEIDEYKDETFVYCLIGPKQTVWALFTFFYAAIILIAVFGGIFGFSQHQLGKDSVFIYFPIALLLVPTIFLFAKAGQRKGRDEMLHLISFIYHSLESKGELERIDLK
jgi:hypothetical protein